MQIENIYKSIIDLKHENVEKDRNKNYLILQPHQIIPKYYIFSKDERHTLILNFSTGSGKTISGLYCILDKLNISKINQFYPGIYIPKAIVIGSWVTERQFQIEMSKQMFGLINQKLIQELKNAENDKEKEEVNLRIQKSMNKIVSFYGYQTFFNLLFPDYSEKRIQDINVLISDYKQGKLKINKRELENLSNNIIIVDEMQNLYAQDGLNTFGFALSYLAKKAEELNLKIIYMSGTIFNSSVSEISSIINLISSNPDFYSISDLCYTEKVLDDLDLYRIRENKLNSIIKELSDKYIYYSRSSIEVKPKLIGKSSLSKNLYLFDEGANKYLFTNNLAINPNYPNELKIGNRIIDDETVIYQLEANDFQLAELMKIKNKYDLMEEDNETSISPFDAGIPPKLEWEKYDIRRNNDGIFEGDFLLRKNINKFSCIGKFVIDLCLNNARNNEKTILYHNKINNFGLFQYGKILEINGFVRRGYDIQPDSICRLCGLTYEKHKKSCPRFSPIYYDFLHGLQRKVERKFIVNQLYNSPNNLYGEIISVLLISDVAYAGISLLNTNNLAILSRVSNMSKITQIQARIVRMKSHTALPMNKRISKFYLLAPTEDINDKNSLIYKYYKLRSLSNENINNFITKLIPHSIGEILLNKPSKYKFEKDEQFKTSQMLFDDGRRILDSLPENFLSSSTTYVWRLDKLVERLRSSSSAVSYIDLSIFPNEFIEKYILNSDAIELFRYLNVEMDGENKFVRNKSFLQDKLAKLKSQPNILRFEDITSDYNITINDYLNHLETTTSSNKKRLYFDKLMNLLSIINDFSSLSQNKYFWEYNYQIGNEYYTNDEEEFISNHSSKKRNMKKIVGCYWNSKIILKNGDTIPIVITFVNSNSQKDINKTFHINAENGLRITIFDGKKAITDLEDLRLIQRGNDCWSYKDSTISSYYKLSQRNKLDYCSSLLIALCDDQVSNTKDKFVITPFERDLKFRPI